ncbi:sodium-coupled monocarboxylate transporter 2-like isoform X2 [Eupeodes corollae]|uniref:sodium-coupled monocarboxylate transporter 2-like isoform X2 n=1 Tax=Eupeodes corollae TaxID=290404 RepID=UPI00248FC799|nr:sodium-coupled monocarboxylate transporter 2-like isoform X2 [Eupeodes corollae]XP_055907646.1 sodium-coupled monocarboxylate transporter 2-like isoform X2 [Eupeodes corollae]XP_055907647.1 sodium-coupled monocarboxylate transporter 2-like isoform X2 [Eupeodes corollae]
MAIDNASNVTSATSLMNVFTFGYVDYAVFVGLLGVSASIGLYFGFFSKASKTTDEYLHGGKRMKTFPIAISLVASQLSGIAIMSIPAEVYSYGINYIFTILSIFLVVPVLCEIAIPVFYENNISNCYEYLQRRFNKPTRQILTFLFILTTLFKLPVYIFIPSLAFSQVTGHNIHMINAIVCSICVFYTMLGGVKAVVWTDVVQALVMVGSVILVAVMGVHAVGGLGKLVENSIAGGRLQPNFEFDLSTRSTVWNALAGSFCMWSSYVGFNQSCVQRIVALPSLSHAKKSLYMFQVGFLIIMVLNVFTGIIIFAKYFDCDPIAMKVVEKADKIVPYFVEDVVGHLYGMPGVFISCVFSASLSTVSANLNSLSGIIYFDCFKSYINHSEFKANLVMKICVVVIGAYCVMGGIIVEQFKSILQVVYTIAGISHGVVFGVFTVGLLVPRVNGKAALIGLILSTIAMLVICGGAQLEINSGNLSYDPLPVSTHGCDQLNTTSKFPTELLTMEKRDGQSFSIFRISFYWYAVLGSGFIWFTSILLSFILPSSSDEKLDPKLVSPIVRSLVSNSNTQAEEVPLKS